MLKKMLMITIVLIIILSASVAGILPNHHHQVMDADNDTLQAAIQFDFNHTVLHSDPECPTATSGNGGGC